MVETSHVYAVLARAPCVVATALILSCVPAVPELEPVGGRSVAEWSRSLEVSDSEAARQASLGLRAAAQETPRWHLTVEHALTSGSHDDQLAAVRVLRDLAGAEPHAMRLLISALVSSNEGVRKDAETALSFTLLPDDVTSQRLVDNLRHEQSAMRIASALEIGHRHRGHGLGGDVPGAHEAVEPLSVALRDDDPFVRHAAAVALARLGSNARRASPSLIAALEDAFAPVRAAAAEALGRMPTESKHAVAPLARALRDPALVVREAASWALRDLGPLARDAIPALCEALRDDDESVCSTAMYALREQGRKAAVAVPDLMHLLLEADWSLRSDAAETLGVVLAAPGQTGAPATGALPGGPPGRRETAALRTLPGLVAALTDEDLTVRCKAAEAIGKIAIRTPAVVRQLVAALTDEYGGVRMFATQALVRCGGLSEQTLPNVVALADDEDRDVRIAALDALGHILPAPDSVAATLVEALRHDDERTGMKAILTLASSAGFLPALLPALRSPDYRVRARAALALGLLAGMRQRPHDGFSDAPWGFESRDDAVAGRQRLSADETREVVSALVRALEDPAGEVRAASCGALAEMGASASAATPALTGSLMDPEGEVRRLAAWGLEGIGPDALEAVPLLVEALLDEHAPVRPHAAMALLRIAPHDTSSVPNLIGLLADEKYGAYAVRALKRKGRAVVPGLTRAVGSGNATTRMNAIRALTELGPVAAGSVGVVAAALGDVDARVARQAATALGRIRSEPEQSIAALTSALRSRDRGMRAVAAQALGAFGHAARAAAPQLLRLVRDGLRGDKLPSDAWATLAALADIRMPAGGGGDLLALPLPNTPTEQAFLFMAALENPDAALRILQRQPELLAETVPYSAAIAPLLSRTDGAFAELRGALLRNPRLPPIAMVRSRDRTFLRRLREMRQNAGPHRAAHLDACIRALGGEADRTITMSRTEPGNFRPASAWPGTDEKRLPPGSVGHGDGFTDLLITGHVLMDDGQPASNPQFYRLNDSLLMGEKRRDPMPVVYHGKRTGRFALFTTVFAAYSFAAGPREEGPHQTGSALVEVVAGRAIPLVVRFYDESPDVLIVLEHERPKGR